MNDQAIVTHKGQKIDLKDITGVTDITSLRWDWENDCPSVEYYRDRALQALLGKLAKQLRAFYNNRRKVLFRFGKWDFVIGYRRDHFINDMQSDLYTVVKNFSPEMYNGFATHDGDPNPLNVFDVNHPFHPHASYLYLGEDEFTHILAQQVKYFQKVFDIEHKISALCPRFDVTLTDGRVIAVKKVIHSDINEFVSMHKGLVDYIA